MEGSSYINASIVQGYRRLQEFIVAQHPLPNTEADFWKMVWDKNSPVVFVLSSEGMSEFWPTEPMEVGFPFCAHPHKTTIRPPPHTQTTSGFDESRIEGCVQLARFYPSFVIHL